MYTRASSGSKGISTLTGTGKFNILVGWFLYPLGDLVGQCLLGRFSPERILVITILGGLVYRFEIPRWFAAVDSFSIDPEKFSPNNRSKFIQLASPLINKANDGPKKLGHLNWLGRTLGGMIYFNPVWIARHLFFIDLAINHFHIIFYSSVGHCLKVGLESFLTNLPVTFIGNYLIQEKLPAHLRFFGSALLSAFMAALYAVEFWLFRHK